MFSSLLSKGGSSDSNNRNETTNRGQLQEHRKNARTILKQQNGLVKPHRENVQQIKNSQYYYYGYRFPTMLTLFGISFAVAQKIPAVGYVGSLAGLIGGFYIGGFFHQIHITWQQAKLVSQIDKSLKVLEEKDATVGTNLGISDFREAIDNLQRERQQALAERAAANYFGLGGAADGSDDSTNFLHQQQQQHGGEQLDPIEMEVNRLIDNFERRKKIAGKQ